MLENLSDEKLCRRLERLVRHERKIMAAVIEHIAEMERRKLYLGLGYTSLFEYLAKKLSYSESAAYRRIQAARALLQVPEIKPQLESGVLKLSQVCLVQKTLRQEEKVSRISLEKRKEIFAAVSGKNGIETEKILDAQISTSVAEKLCGEKYRRDDSVDLHLRLSQELYRKLQKIKELYSHIEPGADWLKVVELMAEDVIQKRDLLAKKTRPPMAGIRIQKDGHGKRMAIPVEIKRQILQRDQGKCQYVGVGGLRCESRHQVQFDHIVPVHQGGRNSLGNLRILCRRHNAYRFQQENK